MESQFLDTSDDNSENEVNQKISVTNLNNIIKKQIKNHIYSVYTVVGEISNKKVCNGNIYFSLKDEKSNINSIIWKSINNQLVKNNISFKNGDKVTVKGRLDFYEKNGSLSLIIFDFKNNNILGDLYIKYQKLKKKYSEKGYFDDINKLKIPNIIYNIGIITSKEGAAVQDIIFVLKNNFVFSKIFIYNCRVQGNECHKEVCNGINYFQNKPIDIIIISRGGGSYEDLFEFSHKTIIKTIHNSKIFTISAIGHQIDYMLSDYVADYRAPTPSIAGEYISDIQRFFLDKLCKQKEYCNNIVDNNINNLKFKISNFNSQIPNLNNIVINSLNKNMISINNIIQLYIDKSKMNLKILNNKLDLSNPSKKIKNNLCFNKNVLLYNNKNKIITSIKNVKNGIYNLQFYNGNIKVKISLI
jgi:exodeoxyribonuclease VII large subunit